jgi:hypothetical protein
MKTQDEWVMEQLLKKGSVTRNQCLARYISRLSAIIWDLKDAGHKIVGGYVKTKNGKDYKYTLLKQ